MEVVGKGKEMFEKLKSINKTLAIKAQLLGIVKYFGIEEVRISGVTYECEPFNAHEIAVWVNDFESYIAPTIKEIEYDPTTGTSKVVRVKPMNITSAILREKAAHIFVAGQVIKKAMGLTFDGYMAGSDKMGFRETKPCDIMRTSDATETPADTWSFSFSADEGNWIGYGTGYSNPVTIDKYIGICVVGVMNLSDNQVVEQIKFKVGNVEFPPIILKPVVTVADMPDRVPAKRIPTVILKPRDTVFGKAYCSAAATNELVLIGVTYGKGSKLQPFHVTTVET
jgi:hypothetical protein